MKFNRPHSKYERGHLLIKKIIFCVDIGMKRGQQKYKPQIQDEILLFISLF